MHILKFPWLSHTEENRKFEVFSVSVSPDGERLASGGLDGKIRIWLVQTLREYQAKVALEEKMLAANLAKKSKSRSAQDQPQYQNIKLDPRTCRPLCSMGRHTGAVTCVRFSPTGRFLASGSDDKILLIWEKDEEKTRIMAQNMEQRLQLSLGSGGSDIEHADLEHWTVRKRLVAHDNDIQDMAWAPDSSILVTVGLDRSIIVWSGTTFEKIKRFDIHQSHVKGVTFDPANKYFATYSDDRTFRIFRYHKTSPTEMTFRVESIVRDPFKKTPLTTYFRRCSWSPDGQNIAVPNAINGGLSSVAIINRGNWASDISLLGHDLPCEVCSFSPRLYDIGADKPNRKNKDPELSTVLATAGQDRTLAIWNTSSATPLLVALDICLNTITDMSWDPKGEILFLASLDGTITSIFFGNNELGKPVPLEQNDLVLHKYGTDRESMVFPESVEQLKLEEKADNLFKLHPVSSKLDRLMGGGVIEDNNKSNLVSTAVASSTTAAPQINTLIPRSKKHPNKVLPSVQLESSARPTPSPKINVLTPTSQKVTVTKMGKKRVAPMLISGTAPSSFQPGSLQGVSKPSLTSTAISKKNKKQIGAILSKPSVKLPRLGLQTLVSGMRDAVATEVSTNDEDNENNIDHIAEMHTVTKKQVSMRFSSAKRKREFELPQYIAPSIISPTTIFTDMRLQPSVLMDFKNGSLVDGEVLEIRNNTEDDIDDRMDDDELEQFHSFNKLFVYDSSLKEMKFEYFNNHKFSNSCSASFVDEGDHKVEYWVFSNEVGALYFFTKNGRQLIPTIQLGYNITNLCARRQFTLAVTSAGTLYCWDLKKNQALLAEVPLAPVINQFAKVESSKKKFENDIKVTSIDLDSAGFPIVTLSNDSVYRYDGSLDCWIYLFDTWYLETLSKEDLHKIHFEERIYKIIYNRLVNKASRKPKPETNFEPEMLKQVSDTFGQLNQCVHSRISHK